MLVSLATLLLLRSVEYKNSRRDKNISNEKINSIYNDVNTAKTFVKWYLIIAGIAAGIVLILFAYFIINSLFVW